MAGQGQPRPTHHGPVAAIGDRRAVEGRVGGQRAGSIGAAFQPVSATGGATRRTVSQRRMDANKVDRAGASAPGRLCRCAAVAIGGRCRCGRAPGRAAHQLGLGTALSLRCAADRGLETPRRVHHPAPGRLRPRQRPDRHAAAGLPGPAAQERPVRHGDSQLRPRPCTGASCGRHRQAQRARVAAGAGRRRLFGQHRATGVGGAHPPATAGLPAGGAQQGRMGPRQPIVQRRHHHPPWRGLLPQPGRGADRTRALADRCGAVTAPAPGPHHRHHPLRAAVLRRGTQLAAQRQHRRDQRAGRLRQLEPGAARPGQRAVADPWHQLGRARRPG